MKKNPFTNDYTLMAGSPELTEREQAVVRFLFEGKTNKEVAASLNISEHTVKDHMKQIMKKLNVSNRVGVIAHFVQPLFRNAQRERRFSHK